MENNNNKIESFFDYCKNYIIDNIENWEGQTKYACDLGDYLTEGPNVDGSLTYSTYRAKEYIREWWYEAGEYWEYEKNNFGENTHNPFDNPEAYMVCMVIEGVNSILSRCQYIEDNWNEEITLDEATIKIIIEQVKEQDDEELF